MSPGEYKRHNADYFQGKKVVANTDIKNGFYSAPAGTVFKVTGKGGGFRLTSEPCKCCGVRLFFTKVSPEFVDLKSSKA